MTTRAERLAAYVKASPAGVAWGTDDCCPWVARWIEQETGRTVHLPVYSSETEGQRLIAEAGGLVSLCERALAPLGLFATTLPDVGDVGVLQLSDRDVAVIFGSGGYALWRNGAGGVIPIMSRPKYLLRVWALPVA